MTEISPLRRIAGLLKTEKKDIYKICLFALFNALVQLSIPLGIQSIINLLMAGRISSSWVLIVCFVMLATLLGGFIQIMQLSIAETIQERLFARSAFDFSFRLPRLRDYRNKLNAQELSNRFFDTIILQKTIAKLSSDIPAAIVQVLSGIILLSLYHPSFLIFGAGLTLMLILIIRLTGPKGLETSLKESRYKYKVAFWLQEISRNVFGHGLSNNDEFSRKKADNLVNQYLDHRQMHFRVLVHQYKFIVGFKVLLAGCLLALGGFLVLRGSINLGQFVASEIVILMVIASAEKLVLSADQIYDLLTAADKIGFFTDMELIDEKEGILSEPVMQKPFRLEVSKMQIESEYLKYKGIKDITFLVNPGDKVCIVGGPNSGKSMLLNTIAGLEEEIRRNIIINSRPLADLNRRTYAKQIGCVVRDELIFKGTIAENIVLGRPEIAQENLIRTIQKLGLEEFIHHLPDGYGTELHHYGEGLPGYVARKIILARAIISNPGLLIVDEAETLVTEDSTLSVYDLLCAKDAPWTLLVTTNDIRLANLCSHLLVIENGALSWYGDISAGLHEQKDFLKYFKNISHA